MDFGAEGADFFVEFGAGGAGNVCVFFGIRPPKAAGNFWFNFLDFGAEGAVLGFIFLYFRPPTAAENFGILRTFAVKNDCTDIFTPLNRKNFACGALAFTSGYFRSLQMTYFRLAPVVKTPGRRRRPGKFLGVFEEI